MPTFPAYLPAPQIDGYGLQPRDAIARSAIEGGIPSLRRRFTARPIMQVNATWRLSLADFGNYANWANAYGHDWFDIDLAGPLGIDTCQARFIGAWSAAPLVSTARWEVSAQIEVRRLDILSGEYLDAAIAYDLTGAYSALHPWVAGQLAQGYYP